jgi:hypothetical protein
MSMVRSSAASIIFVGLAVGAWSVDAVAQAENLDLKMVTSTLNNRAQVLPDLHLKESWLLGLTIAVGLFGVLAAFIQGIDIPWKKSLTAVLGLAISVITVVMTTIFPTDYRGFRAARLEIRDKIEEAQLIVEAIARDTDPQQRAQKIASVQKLLAEVLAIQRKILAQGVLIEILPHAYAAMSSSAPPWVSQRGQSPDRGSSFAFVGRYIGPDLASARDLSLADAVEQASNALSENLDGRKLTERGAEEARAIREYVRRSAATADTYYTVNPGGQGYQYFTLINLDKSFLAPEVVRIILPRDPIKVLEKVEVRQRQRVRLGGEFEGKLALYVGDVRGRSPFRMLLYVPTAQAKITDQTGAPIPTVLARAEVEKVIFDGSVDPKVNEVPFEYSNKKYRLVFTVSERRNRTDRVIVDVFRN